jgi:4-hydroxy-tetrahydrodipicolinate reductase
MINVLINGCGGRMGKELLNQITFSENYSFFFGFDRNSSIEDIPGTPDVIIDFSTPDACLNILDYAKKNKIPMVIATTGFNNDELKLIEAASKEIPIFKSSNMSYETNLVISLVSKLATILNDSDIEIVDVHHNKKVDSPSGTALMIADGINEALDNSMHYEFDRHSKRQPRDKKEIGIHSLRGGTEVGKHSVFFFGENESLEISHTVNSRAVFAKGALKAADFILNQENGLYNMKDLIK